ncbi:hypothetical protein BTHE68_09450 [Burkholderia sp. THE68]|uniref:hypothetical protein n=1 Tax=Burkholderia sp. THE68 TaxID=758782 RepID=UPI001318A3B1|nr:hypothetical protein [Burkholderia sp. THE68]BBU27211.1 hypothetical protein BTHE68_09450 [Burkholderia sp. THE68]
MSITLNDLLEWRDRLPDQSGEEAHMVRALIARRETELHTRVADLIALVSQRENWKLQRCAAVARRAEQMSAADLESACEYFRDRSEGRQPAEAPAPFLDLFPVEQLEADTPRAASALATMIVDAGPPAPVVNLHGVMGSLESRVASTPGVTCGIQGIRIMRMVALMSKARSAQLAKMRMSGTQAFYQHS